MIVPVYNAEGYLRRCLDSILNQSFQDFELLLIDDGSTDGSGNICDEYAVTDKRVQVIHQENKGSSAARQTGFDMAKGEYMVAVDADDWVDKTYLADMYKIIVEENADVVMSAYWFNRDEEDEYKANKPIANETTSWQKVFLMVIVMPVYGIRC